MIGFRRQNGSRAVRLAGAVWVPAAVGLAYARKRASVPRPLVAVAAAGAPIALVAAAPPSRVRSAALWALQTWAYGVGFQLPHDRPLAQRRRLRIDGPLRADTVLGRGTPLPLRLQRRLRRSGTVGPLDVALTAVYALWAVEPHAVLGWILARHPERFPGAALQLGAAYDAALVAYAAVPTAPPWWASLVAGRMSGEVERIAPQVKRALHGLPPGRGKEAGDSNPWAATPSSHLLTSASAAFAATQLDRRAGALAWAYVVAVAFALPYLGEHYGADVVAGLGLAGAIRLAAPRTAPRLLPLIQRLDERAHGRRAHHYPMLYS